MIPQVTLEEYRLPCKQDNLKTHLPGGYTTTHSKGRRNTTAKWFVKHATVEISETLLDHSITYVQKKKQSSVLCIVAVDCRIQTIITITFTVSFQLHAPLELPEEFLHIHRFKSWYSWEYTLLYKCFRLHFGILRMASEYWKFTTHRRIETRRKINYLYDTERHRKKNINQSNDKRQL